MRTMKTVLGALLIGCMLFTSCSKEEEIPQPEQIFIQTTPLPFDTITTKIVTIDIDGTYTSMSTSSYSTNGVLISIFGINGNEDYTAELEEDEFLQVTSTNGLNLGSPYMDVYVDGNLDTTIYSPNSFLSYTYTNDHN